MRLFAAIPVAGPPRLALEAALARWRRQAPDVRWDVAAALHLTLFFIGAWPDAREAELIAALARVRFPPFALPLAGLGAFPDPSRPRLVWAGVAPCPGLHRLAAAVAAPLAAVGLPPENRPFTPHVSLGRVRVPADARPLGFAPDLPAWGTLAVGGFGLYQTLAGSPPETRYQLRHYFPADTSPSTHAK